MNILIVGHLCIDENISEKISYKNWGSPLMYMAKYLNTKPDCNVTLLAPYGEDFHRYLKGMHLANKPKARPSLLYSNESKGLVRKQFAQNSQYAGPIEITKKLAKKIAEADILILATLLPNYNVSYVQELVSHVRQDCITAILPQGYFREVGVNGTINYREFTEAAKIVPLFDMVILSNEDLPNAVDVLSSWSEACSTTSIIMTEGEDGASIIKKGNITQVPTTAVPKTQIIDSVGCGDIFGAATVYNYYHTKDLLAAVKMGNEVARHKLINTIV